MHGGKTDKAAKSSTGGEVANDRSVMSFIRIGILLLLPHRLKREETSQSLVEVAALSASRNLFLPNSKIMIL